MRWPQELNPPTSAELKADLGSAAVVWSGIFSVVEDLAAPLHTEWMPSKSEFGRTRRLQHKKRTLLYLTPEKEQVTVAIILGERAYGLAMTRSLPAAIKQMFSDAKPYAEGRGIRFSVSSPIEVSTIKTLVELKTAPK